MDTIENKYLNLQGQCHRIADLDWVDTYPWFPWSGNTIAKLFAVYLHEIQSIEYAKFSKMFIIGLFLIKLGF